MALHNYTLGEVVGEVCRQYGQPATKANWHLAYGYIGMGGYTLTDPSRIETVNNKIIQHYWFHELCTSPVGRFAFIMDSALTRIMPYYDKLYQAEVLTVANMFGMSYDETLTIAQDTTDTLGRTESSNSSSDTEVNGTSTSEADVTTTDETRRLDTPQAQFTLLDDNYLTTAGRDNYTGEQSQTSTNTATTGNTATANSSRNDNQTGNLNRTESRKFLRTDPNYARVLLELGERLLNVDSMVVENQEIKNCFWLVYDYQI